MFHNVTCIKTHGGRLRESAGAGRFRPHRLPGSRRIEPGPFRTSPGRNSQRPRPPAIAPRHMRIPSRAAPPAGNPRAVRNAEPVSLLIIVLVNVQGQGMFRLAAQSCPACPSCPAGEGFPGFQGPSRRENEGTQKPFEQGKPRHGLCLPPRAGVCFLPGDFHVFSCSPAPPGPGFSGTRRRRQGCVVRLSRTVAAGARSRPSPGRPADDRTPLFPALSSSRSRRHRACGRW